MSLAGSLPVSHAATLGRSIRLFRAFLHEQDDPDRFYGTLAVDTVAQLSQWVDLSGCRVVDVGGGPGYFADAFAATGALYAGVEPDAGELTARGRTSGNALRASGMALPIADHAADVTLSSNVLEHVPEPERMADEMVRVTRPGGLLYLSWTPWLSPWGGHETSPWHYLGGRRAADRYAHHHGHRPKNDYGHTLYPCSVARMWRWARTQREAGRIGTLQMLPRYHPGWARWVIDVPVVREVVAWNAVIVARRSLG